MAILVVIDMKRKAMECLIKWKNNNISMHLKNIFDEGEVERDSVIKKFLTTDIDGKNYIVLHYNLYVVFFITEDSLDI